MNLPVLIKQILGRLTGLSSLTEFGAALDGASDDLPAINAAVAYWGTRPVTLLVSGQCYVSANVTIPATLKVRFEAGGAFVGPGVVTFTRWESILSILTSQLSGTINVTTQAAAVVAAKAHATTVQAIPSAAFTVLAYQVADWDTDGAITLGAGAKWTCPVGKGGKYHVNAQQSIGTTGAAGNTDSFISIFVNGAEAARGTRQATVASSFAGQCAGADLQLAAGDYVQVQFYQASGVSLNTEAGLATAYFSIHRLAGS